MKPSGRLTELDSLRGVAAACVVLFHLTFWYDSFHISPIQVPWSHYGVELFFVISGYVIFMTLNRARAMAEFVVSRVARLMPAYWTAVLLTSAIANRVPPSWVDSRAENLLVTSKRTMLRRLFHSAPLRSVLQHLNSTPPSQPR